MTPKYRVRNWSSKKLRGKRAKEYYIVKIANITPEGFWLHNNSKDYYIERRQFPWFLDATEEELRDVIKIKALPAAKGYTLSEYDSSDSIMWGLLDIHISIWDIEHPEQIKVGCNFVRGVPRPDLMQKSNHADTDLSQSFSQGIAETFWQNAQYR